MQHLPTRPRAALHARRPPPPTPTPLPHLRDVHTPLPQRKHARLSAHRLELRAAAARHLLRNLLQVDAALQALGGEGRVPV